MQRRRLTFVAIAITTILLTIPVHAQNVLTVRIESLDALSKDIDTVAVALGQEPGTADGLLGMVQGALGLPSLDWVDRTNPLVIALPLEGLMFGQQGLVGAFPVSDVKAAIEALKSANDAVSVDDDGLIHFPTGEETELLLLPNDGYLIFGQNANLIGGFDASGPLSGASLPPGSLSAEFNVDSMRAMIGMGMQGLKQNAASMFGQADEGLDAEAAEQAMEMAFGWLETVVANTRSFQLSFELTERHLIAHNHYLPVAGSGLDSFLAAQEAGFPKIASLLDGEDAAFSMAGNVTWTDESAAAIKSFASGYATMMENVLAQQAGDSEIAGLSEAMPRMMELYLSMFSCMRGDIAQVVSIADGLSITSVVGVEDREECSSFQPILELVEAFPEPLSGLVSVTQGAFTHRGVAALEYDMDLPALLALSTGMQGEDEEVTEMASEMLTQFFGEDGLKTYIGFVDGLMITTGGKDADERLRELIDRVKGKKKTSGISAADFDPIRPGAGFYAAIDIGKIIDGVAVMIPAESSDLAELDEVRRIFAAIGSITMATLLQTDAVEIKFAFPTSGLAQIGEAIRASEEEDDEEDEEAEAEPDDD